MDKAERDKLRQLADKASRWLENSDEPEWYEGDNISPVGPDATYIKAIKPKIFLTLVDHIDALEQKREGWKLVPVEPTHQMTEAASGKFAELALDVWLSDTTAADLYMAMLAVAPEPQEVQG